jgi:hypothetical protein
MKASFTSGFNSISWMSTKKKNKLEKNSEQWKRKVIPLTRSKSSLFSHPQTLARAAASPERAGRRSPCPAAGWSRWPRHRSRTLVAGRRHVASPSAGWPHRRPEPLACHHCLILVVALRRAAALPLSVFYPLTYRGYPQDSRLFGGG